MDLPDAAACLAMLQRVSAEMGGEKLLAEPLLTRALPSVLPEGIRMLACILRTSVAAHE
jgi:hypothetical protein